MRLGNGGVSEVPEKLWLVKVELGQVTFSVFSYLVTKKIYFLADSQRALDVAWKETGCLYAWKKQ